MKHVTNIKTDRYLIEITNNVQINEMRNQQCEKEKQIIAQENGCERKAVSKRVEAQKDDKNKFEAVIENKNGLDSLNEE